ncbi:T9SS type A sorting domain-containing protein [Adhaeribacter aquaticus]|uniref:T9SS type A sorting domain-containing protein n=1 Tax=Adhaeribacter aquaticus TaxID=299567 RepID=UPI0003F943B5|nr:T9SS type A sorting domain-containing protein [Adhaeribacter aquaticus]
MVKNLLKSYFLREQNYIKTAVLISAFLGLCSFNAAAQSYRTRADGDWSRSASIWEVRNGNSGPYTLTDVVPSSANSTEILIVHNIAISTQVLVDQTVVLNGASLSVNKGGVLTIVPNSEGEDLTIGGALYNNGAINFYTESGVPRVVVTGTFNNKSTITGASASTLFFRPGSVYEHQFTATSGEIPQATWDPSSTAKITGFTDNQVLPVGLTQTFSNLTLNINNGNTISLASNLSVSHALTISGNGVLNTGTYIVTIAETGSLHESATGYLFGRVDATRTISNGNLENFGGIGVTLRSTGTVYPGVTKVTRSNFGYIRDIEKNTGDKIVRGLYSISPAANGNAGLKADLTLNYSTLEAENFNKNTLVFYRKRDSDLKYLEQLEGEGQTYSRDLNNQTVTLSGVTGFSLWTMGHKDPNTTLPVTLTYFKATRKGANAELAWQTAMEANNQGFELQVSNDGENFRKLAFVHTKNGNSSVAQSYIYTDKEPAKQGVRYYRIKQLDLDGKETFYAVEAVRFDINKNQTTVKAYPNPFTNSFEVELGGSGKQEATLTVTDLTGKKVLEQKVPVAAGLNRIPVSLAGNYPSGVYILNVVTDTVKEQIKLIKQ